ncbi:DNA polymerase sigma subunit [Dendrobium catenatum]|uniref:DNA polymerase sigma subunit n=1 Tax=Dendrobium catenatum TaxID=906689 RepID=A0A2I0VYB8_9ASPA|nr:DNA polymerase sigma subunit [Dendrobium catenatum]
MLVAEVPCDITLPHGSSSIADLSEVKSSKIFGHHNSASSKDSMITKDDAVVGVKPIRLDISFKSTSHTGLQTSELVRKLTQQFPASVPLALVLKKFLADRSLDHSYSGGLSSYCLVLLITRFLQHEHHCGYYMKQNLGSLLMEFLYFFGNVFDPRQMGISIQGSGVYMKRERGLSIDPIHIDDPLIPTNNVGRNCFRIHQCIKVRI